jgi:ABC-type multidrug transport system permease subunit
VKVLLVARKSLVEIFRELQLLALTVLLPLIFLVITALTYNNELLRTYRLVFQDPNRIAGDYLVAIESQVYPNGRAAFEVLLQSQIGATASDAHILQKHDATALVTFRNGDQDTPGKVTIYGDALSTHFYRASALLENLFIETASHISGHPVVVTFVDQSLVAQEPETEFDLYAPGMITFGLLMIIPQSAMLVSREVRWKTLNRLRLSRLVTWQLLAGISLAQMVVAVLQVVIVVLAAVWMGFNQRGSLSLAIVVGLALSFSAIGQGLLVACFVGDDSQAANLGSTFAMVQVFLSGSFYQLPPLTVFSLADHQIDVFDIFPATHGFRALQQVLSYGDGLQEITFRLGATIVLSLFYLLVGILIFRHLKMKPQRSFIAL